MRIRAWRAALAMGFLLASCSTDASGDPSHAAYIDLSPRNLLLVGEGDSWQLDAVVRDAEGLVLDVAVSWEIDDPSVISIDEAGVATALVDAGSSYVRAVVGDVRSPNAFVYPAVLQPNAFVFPDSQFVSGPDTVGDPEADVDIGSRFTVELSGDVTATVGGPIVSREDAAILGRVTEVTGSVVEYEIAAFPDLYAEMDIDIREPLEPEPTPGMTAEPLEISVGLLECETDAGLGVDVTVVEGPSIDLSGLEWVNTARANQLIGYDFIDARVVGTATATMVAEIGLPDPLDSSVRCEISEDIVIPITGPLAPIISPIIEVGYGINLENSLSGAQLGFTTTLSGQVDVELGFTYTAASDRFETFNQFEFSAEGTDIEALPTPGLAMLETDLSLYYYSLITLKLASPLIPKLSLEYATLRSGLRQNLHNVRLDDLAQLADPTSATSYDLEHAVQLEAGPLAYLNVLYTLYRIAGGSPEVDIPTVTIANSPRGTLTLPATTEPDTPVTAAIDLTDTSYLLLDNVEQVHLMHEEAGAWVEFISADGTAGESLYEFEWTPGAVDVGVHRFAAMVETTFLPGVRLEVENHSERILTVGGGGGGGGQIVFVARDVPGAPNDIYTMQPDGSGLTNLTMAASFERSPRWSPDATEIAFTSDRGGEIDIWVMGFDGSDPTQITDSPGNKNELRWSPDGTRIAYFEPITDDVFVVDVVSGVVTPLTVGGGADGPLRWSPDSTRLVWTTTSTGTTTVGLADGSGTPALITSSDPDYSLSAGFFAWASSDTLYLSGHWFPTNQRGIFRVPAAGGPATRLTMTPAGSYFQFYEPQLPDGMHLLHRYIEQSGPAGSAIDWWVAVTSTTDGSTRTFGSGASLPMGLDCGASGFGWSADSTQFICATPSGGAVIYDIASGTGRAVPFGSLSNVSVGDNAMAP